MDGKIATALSEASIHLQITPMATWVEVPSIHVNDAEKYAKAFTLFGGGLKQPTTIQVLFMSKDGTFYLQLLRFI